MPYWCHIDGIDVKLLSVPTLEFFELTAEDGGLDFVCKILSIHHSPFYRAKMKAQPSETARHSRARTCTPCMSRTKEQKKLNWGLTACKRPLPPQRAAKMKAQSSKTARYSCARTCTPCMLSRTKKQKTLNWGITAFKRPPPPQRAAYLMVPQILCLSASSKLLLLLLLLRHTHAVNGGAELRMIFDPLRNCRSERWSELSRGMVFNLIYLRTCMLTRD